jgi:hypothetical protein
MCCVEDKVIILISNFIDDISYELIRMHDCRSIDSQFSNKK